MLSTYSPTLAVQVMPGHLAHGSQLTLAVRRKRRVVETLEPLLRLRNERQLRRWDSPGGDMVYLSEMLLPHGRELLDAHNLD